MMEMKVNTNIGIEGVLEEYNKYLISNLINKKYDFSRLRSIVREFCKDSNIFNYNDGMTDVEIAHNISQYINKSINSNNGIKKIEK